VGILFIYLFIYFFLLDLFSDSATMIGHWPWFATYNFLNARLPQGKTKVEKLVRSAGIGFSASLVSDTGKNSNCVLLFVFLHDIM
jgi:hypothetical protein